MRRGGSRGWPPDATHPTRLWRSLARHTRVIAAFAPQTDDFLIARVLPPIARGVSPGKAAAGQLVTVFPVICAVVAAVPCSPARVLPCGRCCPAPPTSRSRASPPIRRWRPDRARHSSPRSPRRDGARFPRVALPDAPPPPAAGPARRKRPLATPRPRDCGPRGARRHDDPNLPGAPLVCGLAGVTLSRLGMCSRSPACDHHAGVWCGPVAAPVHCVGWHRRDHEPGHHQTVELSLITRCTRVASLPDLHVWGRRAHHRPRVEGFPDDHSGRTVATADRRPLGHLR